MYYILGSGSKLVLNCCNSYITHILEILITFNQCQHFMEVSTVTSTVTCLEIWHSYMRKWKTSQSLSCLTENVIVNFNSAAQTMMPDKVIIYISKY